MVNVTGTDVVTNSVAVEAGKTKVFVLPGCVDTIVLVCPSTVLVTVTVKDEAGKVLVEVDGGASKRDVLTDSELVTRIVVSSGPGVFTGPTSSPGPSSALILIAENAGVSDSI